MEEAQQGITLGVGPTSITWGEEKEIVVEPARWMLVISLGVPSTMAAFQLEIIPNLFWPRIGPGNPITLRIRAPAASLSASQQCQPFIGAFSGAPCAPPPELTAS